MSLTMKPKPSRLRKAKGSAKLARPKNPRTLAELSDWFADNKEVALARAKANTKRLTGREIL